MKRISAGLKWQSLFAKISGFIHIKIIYYLCPITSDKLNLTYFAIILYKIFG